MLYFVCLIIGGFSGFFISHLLTFSNKMDMSEDMEQLYYKAMLDEGLSPRTAQRVEKRVKGIDDKNK